MSATQHSGPDLHRDYSRFVVLSRPTHLPLTLTVGQVTALPTYEVSTASQSMLYFASEFLFIRISLWRVTRGNNTVRLCDNHPTAIFFLADFTALVSWSWSSVNCLLQCCCTTIPDEWSTSYLGLAYWCAGCDRSDRIVYLIAL